MTGIVNADPITRLQVAQAELVFSVVIPAYNKPEALRACLTALTRQSFPLRQFEAIVVDDGSVTPLENVVQSFSDRLQTICIRIPNGGAAGARNHGARAAKGCYLAFTDHDCAPASEWLSALYDAFIANPDHMLGGPKVNGLPDNVYSSAHQTASNYAEDWFRGALGAPPYFTSNNLAAPRDVFLKIGGFDESLRVAQEERELAARWADHDLASAWMPRAVVVHNHELTLFTFLRQQFRYGIGAIDFRAMRRQGALPQSVRFEGLRFHFGLIVKPFTDGFGVRSLQLATLLLLAQAAYAAGVMFRAVTIQRKPAGRTLQP